MIKTTSSSQTMSKRKSPKNVKKMDWLSFRLFDFNNADMSPIDTSDSDSDEDKKQYGNQKDFIIQLFGKTEQGETVCITVPDFKPYFYIQIDQKWKQDDYEELKKELKKRVGNYFENGILDLIREEKHNLYKFSSGKKQSFLKIVFRNTTTMNKVKNLWFENAVPDDDLPKTDDFKRKKPKNFEFRGTKLKLFESNIPPLLKFFHERHINPSGWVKIAKNLAKSPENKKVNCHHEYVCSQHRINPENDKETGVPYKICSFDIEASSSHGDFPVPKKTYKRFAMQLVDIFNLHYPQYAKNPEGKKQTALKKLIKKMILTAFNHSKFEGIDRVYPKIIPEKTFIENLIEQIWNQEIKSKFNEEQMELLKIDSYFSKIKINTLNDGNDDAELGEENHEQVPDISPQNNLLDILINSELNRENKINLINSLFIDTFPQLEGDQITFIGSTFVRQGETQPYYNHCLVVGDCAPVKGVEIQCCETERDLLIAWRDLMQRENPDIIIGYNIFGFDYEFMFQRSKETECCEEFSKLSRLNDHCSANRNFGSKELSLEQKKIRIASGPFDMKYFNMIGRFQIDLYTYFRREFNLDSYKLDDVSAGQICDVVKKTETHPEINQTWLYSKNLKGLNQWDYIHLEKNEYTNDPIEGGRKFLVVEIKPAEKIICVEGVWTIPVEPNKIIQWGLAKDDVSPQDIFRLSNGSAEDRAIVAKYCIQDCNIVHQLLQKIDILTGYNEMARICHVPMKFLVLRGQGIKLTSCLAKYCSERDTLLPDLTAEIEDEEANYNYEGAIVLEPKCGIYINDPVACVDYSSLYPSIDIANNLSQDSKIWTKEYDLAGNLLRENLENAEFDNLPEYDYIDIEYDNFIVEKGSKKTITGKTLCRWAQFPDGKLGIIPSILEFILKARKNTRKMAQTETDDFMKNILDKRQIAYKVTANSIYGQCGSRTSTFYDKDIAASITAIGKKMIIYAKKMVEDVFGDHQYVHSKYGKISTKAEYIYGDTDSVFMTFHLHDCETQEPIIGKKALEITIELAQQVADLCSANLKKPMELTYEKTLMPFIILSKKRYVGMLYENDTEHCKLKFMGLPLKRRDYCRYFKDVYGGILNYFIYPKENTTTRENVENAVNFLNQCLQNLIEGCVSMDKLVITKSLRDYYKNPKSIAHCVLAMRMGERDFGTKPKPGDRMKYAFIETKIKGGLQGEKIETPEFIVKNKLKLDYYHYITNQLMNPILQLLGLVIADVMAIQGKLKDLNRYNTEIKKIEELSRNNLEWYNDAKSKIDTAYARKYLFDPFLQKILNKTNRLTTITDLWGKIPA
jgi:DNA polymerase elongation subunit (family B)